CATRCDIVLEELAVEQHIVAGEKAHDACVRFDAGFLPKQIVAHDGMLSHSLPPSARFRFCIACVAAPLSRLSKVATTTTRLPPGAIVKPPICAPWRFAIRLTHGASSTISIKGSFA